MPTILYDAHLHLADPALEAHREQVTQDLEQIGLRKAVVNGTSPADWEAVLKLAAENPSYLPAIGLHPWKVNDAPDDWEQIFLQKIDDGVQIIGETGLDKWIQGHDIERQLKAFRYQLSVASERNLPVSIHCLKAIGPLMDTLRSEALPDRGVHIHAYGGPIELIPELLQLGAYFSFNAGQLRPDRPEVAQRILAAPADRLLIETDAPAFLPIEAHQEFTLPADSEGKTPNHPANLRAGYQAIAKIRGLSFERLAEQVAANFHQYFLRDL